MSDTINQKDLVLCPGEYAFLLDETKGNISCLVGPYKMSLSQSDRLMTFDETTKCFKPCSCDDIKHSFVTIPTNWYCILKNPAKDNKHPSLSTSNMLPENGLNIGVKIVVKGPDSFALYPGQMATIIQGHTLRTNEYLIAKVYDADSIVDSKNEYYNGQMLIIKGTEYSFYIPPTGIEVIPDANGNYIREAITLTNIEYCVLQDENGTQRYVYGPDVVFPKPTEIFIKSRHGSIIQKPIELSEISGVYVKVISDYVDEKTNEIHHKGEELFITGKDTMIYYPRAEHSIITYDGHVVHHAVAIPAGQGKYVLNRLTGKITTVIGPTMFLPDPRYEVIVRRRLTAKECKLWYPNNNKVLNYNTKIKDTDDTQFTTNSINCTYQVPNFERSNTYTPLRTIELNTDEFDGAVVVNVWSGYAICVIDKSGNHRIVTGPQTVILNYDETLQTFNTSENTQDVYFQYSNVKLPVVVYGTTEDGIDYDMCMDCTFSFNPETKAYWFDVLNYHSFIETKIRSILSKEIAENVTAFDLFTNFQLICEDTLLENKTFQETCGIELHNVLVKNFTFDENVQKQFHEYTNAIQQLNLTKTQEEREGENEALALNREKQLQELQDMMALEAANRRQEIETINNAIEDAKFAQERTKKELDAALRKAETMATADAYTQIFSAIGPELTAALSAQSQTNLIASMTDSLAPLALANGEGAAETLNKLLRGTSIENFLKK